MTIARKSPARYCVHDILWGLPADIVHHDFAALLPCPGRQASARHDKSGMAGDATEAVARWVASPAMVASSAAEALMAVAWCRAAARLGRILPEADFQPLVDRLCAMAASPCGSSASPLVRQLLSGELPFTLACVLPSDPRLESLAESARSVLSAGLIDMLDENGLPHAEYLDLLRPLLACWTRVRALKDRFQGGCWSDEAEIQYQWLVRGALRLTRHDGRHVFSNGSPEGDDAELLSAALKLGGDSDDQRIAAVVLPYARKSPGKAKPAVRALPAASANSEWAATSLMRTDWSRGAARLTAAWPGKACRLELARDMDVLLSGVWDVEVQLDDETLQPASDWEQICWSSDDDVDYLELELDLGSQTRIQRHIVLARKDRFALLADAVLGGRRARIDYRGAIPLGPAVGLLGMKDSREVALTADKAKLAMVLPLALGEWREDGRLGSLLQAGQTMELRQSAEGQRLLAPLWIDLDPKRFAQPLTWRQLSVGDTLKKVADDEACGYRVTVGKHTWLVYRSLAERKNRSLLGHNISREMLVARFGRTGEVDPLIEIE